MKVDRQEIHAVLDVLLEEGDKQCRSRGSNAFVAGSGGKHYGLILIAIENDEEEAQRTAIVGAKSIMAARQFMGLTNNVRSAGIEDASEMIGDQLQKNSKPPKPSQN